MVWSLSYKYLTWQICIQLKKFCVVNFNIRVNSASLLVSSNLKGKTLSVSYRGFFNNNKKKPN